MERLLRQVIALKKPDYHHAYNALGYSLAERGVRLPEARQLIQKALEFVPDDPFISDSLGWVEFRWATGRGAAHPAGRLQGAARSRDRRPPGRSALDHGPARPAQAVWKEGLLVAPENETLQETLKRLRVKP
jgi:tetratricopeptide (TPR) repeat protein